MSLGTMLFLVNQFVILEIHYFKITTETFGIFQDLIIFVIIALI
jgi:hypothetical protein